MLCPLKEKLEWFWQSWDLGGTKIRLGIPNNWRIFEPNWLDIESQFDSNIFQLLWIPGRILVPPVTQLFKSKWLHFFLSVPNSVPWVELLMTYPVEVLLVRILCQVPTHTRIPSTGSFQYPLNWWAD